MIELNWIDWIIQLNSQSNLRLYASYSTHHIKLTKFNISLMNSLKITSNMGYCMVSFFCSNWFTFRTNFPRFCYAIRELSSDFQTHLFLSKHSSSVLKINLQMLYNLFSRSLFHCNFIENQTVVNLLLRV